MLSAFRHRVRNFLSLESNFHIGGIVRRSDEVPAILQRGKPFPSVTIPTIYRGCLSDRPSKSHRLKTLPVYFEAVAFGRKRFEVRKNDRDFRVGDELVLCEWDEAHGFTGRECGAHITFLLSGGAFGVDPEYAIMSIEPELRTL